MPKPPPPQPLPPTTQGPVHAVPCPHCGRPNNCKGLHEMLTSGTTLTCDHCGQLMQIVGVKMVQVVLLSKPRGQVTPVKSQR